MSRINTNVQSLIAQRILNGNNQSLNQSLERLSTGLRITRGKDDPAGLIVSERLRSELGAIDGAVKNSERADQVVNIAEGGLQEVSGLLTELQGLITQSASTAGLSSEERQANQLQIDSILQTIDRIASATSFQGIKLLNGNFDYQASNIDSAIDDFTINGAKFSNGSTLDVDVTITQSAQLAGLYLSFGATQLSLNGSTGSSFVIEIAGALGSRELTFASTITVAQMAANINTFTEVTGVTASASSTGITLNSAEYGSSKFVSVQVSSTGGVQAGNLGIYDFDSSAARTIDGSSGQAFNSTVALNGIRDAGQDLGATINGLAAVSDGRTVRINTDFLDVEMTLSRSTSEALGVVNAFDITGGGADFQLAGNVDIAGKVSLGIQEVAGRKLGKVDVGSNSSDFRYLDDLGSGKSLNVVDGNLVSAQKVVAKAISEVSSLRGRLGAFQKNVVGSTIRSLNIATENTAAAESIIRDADFATETAALTRSQILVSAATQTLGLANTQPQAVLQLLG